MAEAGPSDKPAAAASPTLAAAVAAFQAGRRSEAKALCEAILARAPDDVETLHLASVIAAAQNDVETAVAMARRVIAIDPHHNEAQHNLGSLLATQGRLAEALPFLERAAARDPFGPTTIVNFASALRELGRHEEAITALDRLLHRTPDHAEALRQKGLALMALSRVPSAVALFQRSAEIEPRAQTFNDLAGALWLKGELTNALAAAREAQRLEPHNEMIAARLLQQLSQACDWRETPALLRQVRRQRANALALNRPLYETPLSMVGYDDDPGANLRIAALHARAAERRAGTPLVLSRGPRREGPITVGYLSRDFREHAVAQLMVRCLERHDRQAVRVHAYAYGSPDDSAMRQRVRAAADSFVDLGALDHRRAAERIAADEVDILVELTGHTSGTRLEIAALRPAPIQVAWLGFPGTIGSRYHDYILADRTVAPPADARYFSERLVWLPDSYQPNDETRTIAAEPASRREVGLPDDAFVFCSFNQGYKIEPVMFGLWMELLKALPQAVLWLWRPNDMSDENLRREAAERGVDPARLHFGLRLPKEQHLRRLQLADLALDTRIYNGHTTTSDALWAGLPVVALEGRHFASRVSASLLRAIGLPELVAGSLDAYRDLALELARHPRKLAALRARLAANRTAAPLFDSARFARGLEAAYSAMMSRLRVGFPPAATAIRFESDGRTVATYDELALPARTADALDHIARAAAHYQSRRYDQALVALDRALFDDASFLEARIQKGVILAAKGDRAGALKSFEAVRAEQPDHPLLASRLGSLLIDLERHDEAQRLLDAALAADPEDLDALAERSRLSRQNGRLAEALVFADRALALQPFHAAALTARGDALMALGRAEEGAVALQTAIARDPNTRHAHRLLGNLARAQKNLPQAVEYYRRAIAIDPLDEVATANCALELGYLGDWARLEEIKPRLKALASRALANGRQPGITPFAVLAFVEEPEICTAVARAWAEAMERRMAPYRQTYPSVPRPSPEGRLRIGYLSGDFSAHATMQLMRGLMRRHDRRAIEVFAYATNPSDNSDYRRAAEREPDHFRDLSALDPGRAAQAIAGDCIDILVDLKGWTNGARLEIPALRPAPLQATWLGFPGSTGARFFDYVLGDAIVTPPEAQSYFTEQIVRLPGSYQVNDRDRPIWPEPTSRAAEGLPENALVLASFNQGYKIEPVMFGLWMELLQALPQAVLWLWRGNDGIEPNLKKEAALRGVDPARLIFAGRATTQRHLRRIGLADLALDPRIVNGHTTTSDALWAGLPVVTLKGAYFPARVSASLLQAVGLPELVAESLGHYREIVLRYGRDPAALAGLKAKLAANRLTAPLFDTDRFARKLEAAYRAMWRRHCAGLAPAPIDVPEP
ncbi:MAG TPA: tetratricopeptide repeat protein [Hypericibacter adhaerens]|uniref:O-linked N-acetylglucosamine transferase, SPINDLY family protein n=1 Tax=Hypericibacter adhaerens TaxID=2602016 RepID=UPI002CC98E36|nr:tetratricopeptide repeat protein [Hypericibacter adhaerens]HWA42792.1 tetratricopeptide repeat protein [Hypericibacter adhaerens]